MKIRTDFVTNSSSSAFVTVQATFSKKEYAKLFEDLIYEDDDSYEDENGLITVGYEEDEAYWELEHETITKSKVIDCLLSAINDESIAEKVNKNKEEIEDAICAFSVASAESSYGSETDCSIDEALSLFSGCYSEDEEEDVIESLGDREIGIGYVVEYKEGEPIRRQKSCWLDGEEVRKEDFRFEIGLDWEECE